MGQTLHRSWSNPKLENSIILNLFLIFYFISLSKSIAVKIVSISRNSMMSIDKDFMTEMLTLTLREAAQYVDGQSPSL